MRSVSLLFSSSLLLLLTSNPSFSMMEKEPDLSFPQSKSTFKPLAKKNDAEAQYKLGMIYLGDDLKKAQAIHWLERAAEQEYVPAQNQLIQTYLSKYDLVDGEHIEKDIENVIKWAKRASKNNSPEAQHALGCLYKRGVIQLLGVQEVRPGTLSISEISAVKSKLAEAKSEVQNKNNSSKPDQLSSREERARREQMENEENLEILRRAEKQGWLQATGKLGVLQEQCLRNQIRQEQALPQLVKRKLAEAQIQLQETKIPAIRAGLERTIPMLQRQLAEINAVESREERVRHEQIETLEALKKAGKLKYLQEKTLETLHQQMESERALKNASSPQQPVEEQNDFLQMAFWWRLAADQGYAPAQFDMGWAYETGTGVNQNLVKAVSWYGKAARNDHPDAGHSLKQLISLDDALPDVFFVKNK